MSKRLDQLTVDNDIALTDAVVFIKTPTSNPRLRRTTWSALLTALLNTRYVATLVQSGTSIPVATALKNMIGTVTFSRSGVGVYVGTSAGAFPANSRTKFDEPILAEGSCRLSRVDSDSFQIETFDSAGDPADSLLNGDLIVITIY